MKKGSEIIYVDNNATTCIAPEVFEEMKPFLTDYYGNASSIHCFGGQVRQHLEKARANVAMLIGALSSEVVFTSCGTESDNTAILSALAMKPGRRHIITSQVEHPAVLTLCKDLEKRGYRVDYLPVNRKGSLCMRSLREKISEETAIVSLMWANNETGNIFPVEVAASIAHDYGALFHTDAVQAVGKIDIDMQNNKIDFLSLSGHKLHAPKGVGALYVRKGLKLNPLLIGGHQEFGLRAGTENVASIVGLGRAAILALANMDEERTKVAELRDFLEAGLLQSCPDAKVNGNVQLRLPNTTNISFEYIEGESILLMLDQFSICASSGSACTSGSLEPSHVMRAMSVPYTAAHGSIRFSLSRYNTKEEMEFIIAKLPPIIKRLREMSPYGRD